MDADAYAQLRATCIREHSLWEQVADAARRSVIDGLRLAGIEAEVSARAKEVDSLLRKLVFKYGTDDVTRATDRAGARVVVHLPGDVRRACEVIRRTFEVVKEERTADRYEADQFGYRGVHLDAIVAGLPFDTGKMIGVTLCEVQVRTVAEHAWSVLSHLLAYKSPGDDQLPYEMKRRIHRLVAIVELFDQEARGAHDQITGRPEYAVHKLIYDIERLHHRVTGLLRRCDADLTAELATLYQGDPSAAVSHFVDTNMEKLRTVFAAYDESISPLMRRPEALVLWERLEHDAVALERRWAETGYPQVLLENMATVWGIDLPDLA